jgi:hypothetical protein
MPLQTDLNQAPYYNDFDPAKGYQQILFKPGVAVQARELNQYQSMLQNQIEKFGDNIFRRGTIIEGCGLTYFPVFPYVKLKDAEVDGTPVNVSSYRGLYAKNSDGLEALIVTSVDGFESQSPDLNTIYVKYTNSGNDGNTSVFSANQVLTIYDKGYPIFSYDINDGSSGFSNSDSVVVVSSLEIQNSTGGSTFPSGAWDVGHVIQNNVANLTIVEANSTANSTALILRVKPLAADLKLANSVLWTFNAGDTIRNATTANTANVAGIVGVNAAGSLVTDSLGKILSIAVTNYGSGYYVPPYVTVSIASNSSITTGQVNQLDVDAFNYRTTVSVADSARLPIGTGYGLKIAPGVVYQKGFFSRVLEQTVIVNKYSNTDFDYVVGFTTEEEVVTSDVDETLLDNATGTYNYAAPGADRLQLNPTLVVLKPAEAVANTDFLSIIEFTDGNPFRQRTQTVYSTIGDEMAKRTYEESGNYVINQFLVLPKDDSTLANTANTFQIIVDPGVAYIKGYRVATTGNFTKNVNKGSNTVNVPAATSRVAYGSYIKINNVGGIFRFNYGDTVSLYDTAKTYLSGIGTGSNAITAPSGNVIGTARMRGLLPGDNAGEYHLYLFDIKMSAGKNFVDTRSVYYNNTLVAVADTVLQSNNTLLLDTGSGFNGLLVKNHKATAAANSITYTYRTFDTSKTANSTGYATITPGGGQAFPYSGTLTTPERKEFLVVPKGNYQAQVNAAGTVTFTSTTANVTGSGTSFLTAYRAGDYVKVANSTANAVARVLNVSNNTFMTLTANASLTIANQSCLYYPNNVPLALTRDGRSVVVESNGSITIFIGNTVANTAGSAASMDVAIAYNIKDIEINPDAKTIKRGIYARIKTSNNYAGSVGPWPLGASDVFRMRQVLQANGASLTLSVNSETAVANSTDFITVSDNKFANGDSLLYSNTTGAVIVGLANNTTYYAVDANTTGFKLAATRNGSAIGLTAVSGGGNHSFIGSPTYFANGTNGTVDISNEFYIDHRQNEDYLDISYLVRKPNLPALSNNDVLLVKFDAFTSTAGVKSKDSYNITDGVTVATMGNTSINTLEIPEVWGINGEYYDLRDQFDFRPSVANTIPLISEASNTSILNPELPASKFTASDKKFPISDSDLIANVSYYQGRTDRVIVDVYGTIDVIRGYDGRTEPPPPPNDSVTLQLLEVPPYPSLPKSMTPAVIALADTQVYNGKGSRRIFEYTVGTPIDSNQRERLQIRNYKMEDIASIEQRVSDLEYYVSYTLAETVAKARFIPSSLDGGVDRYKVGFFVDPFTNYNFAETQDPEFYATIEDDQLTTHINETILEFRHETAPGGGESMATLDYVEVTAFKQLDATNGPLIAVTANTVTPNTTPVVPSQNTETVTITTVTQQITSENKVNKSTAWGNGTVYEDWTFTMSALTGPVEIYANHRGLYNAFAVYQSETPEGPWVEKINSNAGSGVSNADINTKGIANLEMGFGFYKPGVTFRDSSVVPGTSIYWFREHQKILFTHDPADGIYYMVRVYKGRNRDRTPYGNYEYKIFYPTDSISSRTITTNSPDTYVYVGEVVDINPRNISVGGSNIDDPRNYQVWTSVGIKGYTSDAQLINNSNQSYWYTTGSKHRISIIGLKPNTVHTFTFDGVLSTDKCTQIRTTTDNTSGLKSDANGTLSFDFYNDLQVDWETILTNFAQDQIRSGSTPGNKSFTVASSDGSSIASGVIGISPWLSFPQISIDYNEISRGLQIFQ